MNENELCLVKQYNFENPLCSEMDSVLHSCFKHRQNTYFHKCKCECIQKI